MLSTFPTDVMIKIFSYVGTEKIGIFHLNEGQSFIFASGPKITYNVIHTILSNSCMHFFITEDLISCEKKAKMNVKLNCNQTNHLHTARKRHAPSSLIGLMTKPFFSFNARAKRISSCKTREKQASR